VDIFGFKSFGFKNTTVNFEPGLVSISGPNGSGKSNILDAIMFAMGENRAKLMRVDKLKSLIHDIEGKHHGPKMTRVSVTMDNSDRKIPVDSNNVVITREMDDKGENVYYLEHKKVNRSHILDLLEMANAGLQALNVVQQGTVTRISEFSPEEKRESIENLIGLSYFDEKKSESIKQLDEADRRLDIALAKMGEIKKRIDELEEERNLKLRFDFIQQQLGKFTAISAFNRLKTINSEKISKERTLHSISSEIKKLEEERKTIKQQTHEIEAKKSEFMEEANAYNKSKAAIDSELSVEMQKYEEAKSSLITKQRRLDQIVTRLPEIKTETEGIEEQVSSISASIDPQKTSIQTLNEQKKKINNDLTELDSKLSKVMRHQSQISNRKHEIDNKIKNLINKLNEVKLLISKLESTIQDFKSKCDGNSQNNNNKLDEIKNLVTYKNRLELVLSNHKESIKELKSRIYKLNSKKLKIEKDIDETTQILEKVTKAATRHETKIRVGKEFMYEDYSIAKLKENSDELGVEGLVYELLSWDKKYERAILAVGSDWLKAFVVKNFERLLHLADIFQSRKLPKLKIIPLDTIPNLTMSIPAESGIIGELSNYIQCNSKFNSLKNFLFGNVILVHNKQDAYRISRLGFKTVTIDGEFVESKARAVVVDVNSKISNLTKVISLSTSVDGLIQSIGLLKNYVSKRRSSLAKLDVQIKNHQDRLFVSETGLANANNSYSGLSSKILSHSKSSEQLLHRNNQLEKKTERLSVELVKQHSHMSSLKERIRLVQENYSDSEQQQIAEELTRLNETRTNLLSTQTSIISQLRDMQTQLNDLTANLSREKSGLRILHEENSSLNAERHELEVSLRRLEKEKNETEQSLVGLREKEQELITTSGVSVERMQEYDARIREHIEKERLLSKEINSFERQFDSLNRDLKEINDNIEKIQKLTENYNLDEFVGNFDVESLVQILEKEKQSLVSSLSQNAPEKYLEVSSGYKSTSGRKNELESERNSIVKFIEEVEKEKRQTFLNAFDIVDKEIREIFSDMTGGNAWLELQNEDDIFSSGISYLIQFPNKPKRESTSISGGEKTLAAIVFVLALQKLKPSPFYLFDEVDAHLDAPNAEKLSKIIEQRSEGSQFIMVSLKDSVVQKAKLIYGVFPKNGVSNVVTYKDKRLPSMVS